MQEPPDPMDELDGDLLSRANGGDKKCDDALAAFNTAGAAHIANLNIGPSSNWKATGAELDRKKDEMIDACRFRF